MPTPPTPPIPANDRAKARLAEMPRHTPSADRERPLPPGATMHRNGDAFVGVTDTGEICGTHPSEDEAIDAVRWRMGYDDPSPSGEQIVAQHEEHEQRMAEMNPGYEPQPLRTHG